MKTVLKVQFNEFYSDKPECFIETVCADDGEVLRQTELKRRPRAARFDEVYECGCGADSLAHEGYCTRAQRVYRHPLLRR